MSLSTSTAPGVVSGEVRRWPVRLGFGVAAYVALAYIVLPLFWRHYEHLPAMASMPTVTRAPNGLPGDPLNVALVGAADELGRAFTAAGWGVADPLGIRSSLGIAESVLLDRPDAGAPVSTLLLFDRPQDLAFERAEGRSARERHHVRLWRTELLAPGARPVWIGAATFDRGVGLSHTTGQITHHIAADVDAERDRLMADLGATGQLGERYDVTGIGPTLRAWNAGGDPYFTDGELTVGVMRAASAAMADTTATHPVTVFQSPLPVVVKNQFWSWIRPWLAADGAQGPVRQ